MLSVVIITKNEENIIADCIESIKDIASEIIVVDANSSDRTVEIAERLGAKVYKNDFKDFSEQRNFAFEKAKGDWIFYIDSDERTTEAFKKDLKNIIANHDENLGIGGYFIKRKNYFFNKDWSFYDNVQRLFYRRDFLKWQGELHETPKIKGKFDYLFSPIIHLTHRNLNQMLEKTIRWSDYEADLRFRAKHPKMSSWRFIRIMLTGFFKSYLKEKGYKNGTFGLIEAMYQSFSMFITYAKLWERQIGLERKDNEEIKTINFKA